MIEIPDIELPNIAAQQTIVFEQSTLEGIKQLKENLKAKVIPGQSEINEGDYCNQHLVDNKSTWQAPHADIVGAYFRHFQNIFNDYDTDKKLAFLLGLSSDRRIREFKQGTRKVPYDVWRKFLVITGRAPQKIIKVMCFTAG
ncbi:MAG: hypothetical protein HRT54_16355 [Colwellia sp.]|nr:hypothetical protein [Colwellia sp.]